MMPMIDKGEHVVTGQITLLWTGEEEKRFWRVHQCRLREEWLRRMRPYMGRRAFRRFRVKLRKAYP